MQSRNLASFPGPAQVHTCTCEGCMWLARLRWYGAVQNIASSHDFLNAETLELAPTPLFGSCLVYKVLMGSLSRDHEFYAGELIISEKLIDYGSCIMHCIVVTIHCVWLLGYCHCNPTVSWSSCCQELVWVSLYGLHSVDCAIAVPRKWDTLLMKLY